MDKPKSTERVKVDCCSCGIVKEVVLAEHIRRVNNQSSIVESYHCPECYIKHPGSLAKRKQASLSVIDKIKAGSSERSKKLWLDPSYLGKKRKNIEDLKNDKAFSSKISEAIKNKFATDVEYVAKIKTARKNYHNDSKNPLTWNADQFISAANIAHYNKYDYSKIVYHTAKTKVEVVCPVHGSFWVRPSHHIHYKNGCPDCNNEKTRSKGEDDLYQFIAEIYQGPIIRSDRQVLGGLEIDIWLPEIKLGIEHHGAWYHSTTNLSSRNYHSLKSTLAYKHGINLLQFVDIDLKERWEVAKSMIRHKLGLSQRVFARKCDVVKVDSITAKRFFDVNHYHAGVGSDIAFGLLYGDSLLCVLSFKIRGEVAEISRFATALNYHVSGGFSKLLKHFVRHNSDVRQIFTYVDRSFTTSDSCYSESGMRFEGITKPGYRYFKNNRLFSRFKFQKHKLASILPEFDPSKSEFANMFSNGYRILFDSGNLRYRLML